MSADVHAQQPNDIVAVESITAEVAEELIRVHIHDSHASSTTLRIDANTTAEQICATLAAKMKVPLEFVQHYVLVVVVSTMREGSFFSLLHSLQPKECLLPSRKNEQQKMVAKLKDEDDLEDSVLETLQLSVRWYFKDSRLPPIELQGEVSGGSDSEDEHTCSEFDARYLAVNSGERNGYLLRRSKKDPNLWRKRYCVLTTSWCQDKLWCIRTRGRKVSSYVSLADSSAAELPAASGVAHGFQLQNPHRYTAAEFRTDSRSTQQGWIHDTNKVCALTSENELIQLSEIIICDEESTRAARMHRSINKILASKSVQHNLEGARRMKSPSVMTLERRHDGAAAALSFMVAVQRYKETFRHELRYTYEQQWRAACQVFVDHVRHELVKHMEAQTQIDKPPSVVDSRFTLPALVRMHSILFHNVTYSAEDPEEPGTLSSEDPEEPGTLSSEGEEETVDDGDQASAKSADDMHLESKPEDTSVFNSIIPFFRALTFASDSPTHAKSDARNNGSNSNWALQHSMSEDEFQIEDFPEDVLALLPDAKGKNSSNSTPGALTDLLSYRERLASLLQEMKSSWLLTDDFDVALGLRTNAVPTDPTAIVVVTATAHPRELRFGDGPPPISLFDELTDQISATLDVPDNVPSSPSTLD